MELDFEKEITWDKLIHPNDLLNKDYHQLYGISASGLKQAHKDPKLYAKKDLLMRLPSPALDMGSALHEALLEPEKFNIDNYSLTPANKIKLSIMVNNGKVMFDYILSKTKNERSIMHQDEGFVRKVRPDAYDERNGIIYDVKTTRYNSKSKFKKDAFDLGYHIQSAFYIDTMRLAGFKANHFVFLVIPSESPCEPFALQASQTFIEDGRGTYTEVIQNIVDYDKSSESVFFDVLDLPAWRREQLGEI